MSDEGQRERKRPRSVRELMVERPAPTPTPARARAAGEPRAVDQSRVTVRRFSDGTQEWLARVSGACVYGTGVAGTAPIVSISFARAATPDSTARIALSASGILENAFDEELVALLERARPIEDEPA